MSVIADASNAAIIAGIAGSIGAHTFDVFHGLKIITADLQQREPAQAPFDPVHV